jgi:pyruvate/2-oxoglutarate dehydrogenase complex dihydrolipoamide acyltransferase (E2) component
MPVTQRIPVVLPDLGSQQTTIVQWLVEVPAKVTSGDRILELLADGVLFHLAAEADGWLVQQECRRGCGVTPGETLGWIESVDAPAF